jgi:hypothetical protein
MKLKQRSCSFGITVMPEERAADRTEAPGFYITTAGVALRHEGNSKA